MRPYSPAMLQSNHTNPHSWKSSTLVAFALFLCTFFVPVVMAFYSITSEVYWIPTHVTFYNESTVIDNETTIWNQSSVVVRMGLVKTITYATNVSEADLYSPCPACRGPSLVTWQFGSCDAPFYPFDPAQSTQSNNQSSYLQGLDARNCINFIIGKVFVDITLLILLLSTINLARPAFIICMRGKCRGYQKVLGYTPRPSEILQEHETLLDEIQAEPPIRLWYHLLIQLVIEIWVVFFIGMFLVPILTSFAQSGIDSLEKSNSPGPVWFFGANAMHFFLFCSLLILLGKCDCRRDPFPDC